MINYDSGSTGNKSAETVLEILIWLLFASTPALLLTQNFVLEHSIQLWIGCILLLFIPIIFLLIFEELPIRYLKKIYFRKKWEKYYQKHFKDSSSHLASIPKNEIEEYLDTLTQRSDKTSQSILSRSKVFLFISCLFALIGILAIVFSDYSYIANNETSETLPKYSWQFGILAFCLLMTLLFLRQYRKLMEDYLQFEQIKKKREDNLSALRIYKEKQKSDSKKEGFFLDELLQNVQNDDKKN